MHKNENILTCTFHKELIGVTKFMDLRWTCSKHGEDMKCIQLFFGKGKRRRPRWDLDRWEDRLIDLKEIGSEGGQRLVWLMIGPGPSDRSL